MLFLNRKIGESIIINENIEIIVQEISGKSVKLGINHPDKSRVLRKELFEKIQKENKKAADSLQALQLLND